MTLDPVSVFLIFASIVVFAIHNIEETVGIEAWTAAKFPPQIAHRYRKKPFFVATVLLWLAYSAVAVIAIRSGNPTALLLFAIAFAAIVANGLFHILAAAAFRKTSPGFWSAIVLTLPLGGVFAWHTITTGLMTLSHAMLLFLAGAIVQAPLAAGAILIANFLIGLKNKNSSK